jgi:hypothetical protein
MRADVSRQLRLSVEVSGGELASEVSHSIPPISKRTQTRRLIASLHGYFKSRRHRAFALVGEGIWCGAGNVEFVPNLDFRTLLKHLVRGRPVVFVQGKDNSPFERLLGLLQFDPNCDVRAFLNGNVCLTMSGVKSGCRVFAHVGGGAFGSSTVQRHVDGLSHARTALMETSLLRTIAAPIANWNREGISVLMQNELPGEKVRIQNLTNGRLSALLQKAASPLLEIHTATATSDVLPELVLLRRMQSESVGLDRAGVSGRELTRIIDDVSLWIEQRRPKSVRAHGDYTLQNILFDSSDAVSAIIDWEWSRPDACAGFDIVHFGAWTASDYLKKDVSQVLVGWMDGEDVPEPVASLFAAMFPALELENSDLPHLAKLVWLLVFFRSSIWTRAPTPHWVNKFSAPMRATVRASQ